MSTYREKPVERKILRKPGVYVVASSFGTKDGNYRVGRVSEYRKHLVEVVFKDEEGQDFSWRFSLRSGIRTQDIGASSGWRIILDDLREFKAPAKVHKPKTRARKLHEEIVDLKGGQECAVWQVFQDGETGRLYFKAFRRNKETGKEKPYTAPMEKILEIMYQFVQDW